MIERVCEMVPTYTPCRGRETLGVRREEIGGKEKRFSERRNGLGDRRWYVCDTPRGANERRNGQGDRRGAGSMSHET